MASEVCWGTKNLGTFWGQHKQIMWFLATLLFDKSLHDNTRHYIKEETFLNGNKNSLILRSRIACLYVTFLIKTSQQFADDDSVLIKV